ncbi:MAG: hypothetical protein ABW003_30165 [Microvirga sp.]
MKYNESRRPGGIESAWLRLKLWLHPVVPNRTTAFLDTGDLSEHLRRDIGMPDPVRYADWKSLRANGWSSPSGD